MRQQMMQVIRWAGRPLERFLRIEASSGIILLVAAAAALLWANSRWAGAYEHLWRALHDLAPGPWVFERNLEWVVNDGLMVIFFFVVGMEIRREIHHGELSEPRRAALPALAALGGMVVPALIYLSIASAPATRSGWGVPMATDIAFAVGVMTLLGRRVPAALRVLLLALAVIDDLGAIIVIALFYSVGTAISGFVVAAFGLGVIFGLQLFKVRHKAVYILPAVVVWAGTYAAGIHPTIAGVVVGLITPVTPLPGREDVSPADRLIELLHPWVAYGIMPIFALANAGVSFGGMALTEPSSLRASLGAALGLIIGKPIGVLAACGLSLWIGVAALPRGLTTRHLVVLGLVAGIGFTMALFIAQLAFSDPKLLGAAKLGILGASGVTAILGLVVGRVLLQPTTRTDIAATADEAEASTEL